MKLKRSHINRFGHLGHFHRKNLVSTSSYSHALTIQSAVVLQTVLRNWAVLLLLVGLFNPLAVIDDVEVVLKAEAQIWTAQDIIFTRNNAVYHNVDCEATCCELSINLFINLNKHVVWAFYNRLFWLFFTNTVSQAQFIKRNLGHKILKCAIEYFLRIWTNKHAQVFWIGKLRIAKILKTKFPIN